LTTKSNNTPGGTWYQSTDGGMEGMLIAADKKEGYTLSNKGTYLAMKNKIKLRVIFEKYKLFLFNPYHVMAANPAKYPSVNYNLATKYIDYVIFAEAQDIIRSYGEDKYGEALFVPAANVPEN
jgi:tungstate transport system substrate-binding protein